MAEERYVSPEAQEEYWQLIEEVEAARGAQELLRAKHGLELQQALERLDTAYYRLGRFAAAHRGETVWLERPKVGVLNDESQEREEQQPGVAVEG